jgi:hypothetical protein
MFNVTLSYQSAFFCVTIASQTHGVKIEQAPPVRVTLLHPAATLRWALPVCRMLDDAQLPKGGFFAPGKRDVSLRNPGRARRGRCTARPVPSVPSVPGRELHEWAPRRKEPQTTPWRNGWLHPPPLLDLKPGGCSHVPLPRCAAGASSLRLARRRLAALSQPRRRHPQRGRRSQVG